MNWYIAVLNKYAVFTGRARRKEYWMFTLFNMIFAFIAIMIDITSDITVEDTFYGPLYVIYMLAMFVPSLAVTVRRLHDVNKSGMMILVALIPIIGAIWLLVLSLQDSQPGINQYGPSPKYPSYI